MPPRPRRCRFPPGRRSSCRATESRLRRPVPIWSRRLGRRGGMRWGPPPAPRRRLRPRHRARGPRRTSASDGDGERPRPRPRWRRCRRSPKAGGSRRWRHRVMSTPSGSPSRCGTAVGRGQTGDAGPLQSDAGNVGHRCPRWFGGQRRVGAPRRRRRVASGPASTPATGRSRRARPGRAAPVGRSLRFRPAPRRHRGRRGRRDGVPPHPGPDRPGRRR